MAVTTIGRAIRRRVLLVAGMALPATADAQQAYPTRPVRLISINAAGGMVDAMLRLLAERMAVDLGQPVLVDNRPGANGLIAAEATTRAPPDGYAVLVANGTTFTTVPWLQRQLPYDPVHGFTPIGRVLISGAVLVAPADAAFADLPGLRRWARARGESLTYGSWGSGSGAHLFGEVLHRQYGIPLEHVPYRGEQAALTDLIAGRVALTFCTAFGAKPHAAASTLKPIGITGSRRSPIFPDLPTFREQGVAGCDLDIFAAAWGPPGLPRPIVDRINGALGVALGDPTVQARMREVGQVPAPSSTEELTAMMVGETLRWRDLIDLAGLQPS
jgi:tripartite-type tricarboxylate transporter receptor subunit TctC